MVEDKPQSPVRCYTLSRAAFRIARFSSVQFGSAGLDCTGLHWTRVDCAAPRWAPQCCTRAISREDMNSVYLVLGGKNNERRAWTTNACVFLKSLSIYYGFCLLVLHALEPASRMMIASVGTRNSAAQLCSMLEACMRLGYVRMKRVHC